MTQEEKQLLLKDLSTRLPYEVKLDNGLKLRSIDALTQIVSCSGSDRKVDYVKPYLRPMSSMTEEEKEELRQQFCYEWEENITELMYYSIEIGDADCFIDWLNAHYFDYRGLIEKGLALEAPKDMYK